jgi:hypothetical protein
MQPNHKPRPNVDGIIGVSAGQRPPQPVQRPAQPDRPRLRPKPVGIIDDMVARPKPRALPHLQPYQLPQRPPQPQQTHQTQPQPQPHQYQAQPRPAAHDIRPVQPPIRHQPVHTRPSHETPRPQPGHDSAKKSKQKGKLKNNNMLQYILIVVAASVVGIVLPNIQYGQWAIAAYGVFALIFRVKSQVTFALALFALMAVPVLILINQKVLAENYAVYSFLLLVIGVISATIELKFSKPEKPHVSHTDTA